MVSFLEAESLCQGQVDNGQPWSPEVIPAFVAELEQRAWICWARCGGAGKRRGVKPLCASLGSIGVPNNVGEPIASIVDVASGGRTANAASGKCLVQIAIHDHGERIAALRNEGSRYAPPADECVHYLATVKKPFAFAKG